jgi:ubiquinone biosynthesis protein
MVAKSEKERFREILSVFVNHGIGKVLTSQNIPVSLRESFEVLGPTFIKIGQILSLRPDLFSDEYTEEFAKLQNEVKPEAFDDIKKVIEGSLKKPLDELFLLFDKNPIACASMAQVHLAYLKDGTKVVVKVQRPEVRETMLSDIAILKRLARYMKRTPQSKILNFQEIAEEIEDSAKKEMDFLMEADNIRKFRQNNKGIKYITCPYVYDEYTTDRIIVMDFIEGIKISEIDKLAKRGYDVNEIGMKLADNYFKQIFEDGFFHADPHPGNIMINENKIAYIDFGMMGTLSKSMKERFNDFLYGLAFGDAEEMAGAVLKICVKKGNFDINEFRSDVEKIYGKYIDTSLGEIDLKDLIGDIFSVCRRNSLSLPREMTMLFKGMITIESVLEKLSPNVRIMEMLFPYVKKQILNEINISNLINMTNDHIVNLYLLSKSGFKITRKITKLINNASTGNFKIQMEHINLDSNVSRLNRMVNRVVFSIIIAAIIIGSSMIVSAEIGPKFYGVSAIALAGYIGALVMGLWLLILIVRGKTD